MKTRVLLSAIVVLALAALFFLRTRREVVAIRDLTWSEHDGSVTFEFRAVNLTDEPVSASVDLVAE